MNDCGGRGAGAGASMRRVVVVIAGNISVMLEAFQRLTLSFSILSTLCKDFIDIFWTKSLLDQDCLFILQIVSQYLQMLVNSPLRKMDIPNRKELWCERVFLAFLSFPVVDMAFQQRLSSFR